MTHRIPIKRWRPASLNQLMSGHWRAKHRLKLADRELVGMYAVQAGVPKAEGKRRVSLEIVLQGRQQEADPDAYWKSLLDALVYAGLLVDDSREWCELGAVTYSRGDEGSTTIVLEDV